MLWCCGSCSHWNLAKQKVCPQCGCAAKGRICRRCGERAPKDAQYCVQCGSDRLTERAVRRLPFSWKVRVLLGLAASALLWLTWLLPAAATGGRVSLAVRLALVDRWVGAPVLVGHRLAAAAPRPGTASRRRLPATPVLVPRAGAPAVRAGLGELRARGGNGAGNGMGNGAGNRCLEHCPGPQARVELPKTNQLFARYGRVFSL